jgi:cobalt/nickel transport system permease protein
MHIPDGYLGPSTYGGLWAAMIGIWSYASRRVKQDLKTSQVPFLAMASAFSFVAMIFTIPLPGGTTAHITGATLIAVLIGPWAAVIAVSVALIIQSLVFGDGGVTAIAANCFNIAFVGSLFGYAVFRLVIKVGEQLRADNRAPGEGTAHPVKPLYVLGTALGAYAGMNAAALFTAIELGIQPLIYGSGQGAGYFPYSLKVAVPAVMIPHLTLVGTLEAVVAALVVFLRRGRPEIIGGMRSSAVAFVAAFLLFSASASSAHDFWIEQKGEDLMVVFGHGTQREEFDLSKIKSVRVIDSQGKDIPLQKEKKEKGLVLRPTGRPAAVVAEIDNGYWSKTIYGWKELPKRKASRVVEAIRSLFYTKTFISWSEAVQAASGGAKLDIIPMKNPFEMKAGDSLPLKVLLGGKPLPGAEVIGADHAKLGTADNQGLVSIALVKGNNLVTVEYKERIKDDPDADALSLTATLTFEVKK